MLMSSPLPRLRLLDDYNVRSFFYTVIPENCQATCKRYRLLQASCKQGSFHCLLVERGSFNSRSLEVRRGSEGGVDDSQTNTDTKERG